MAEEVVGASRPVPYVLVQGQVNTPAGAIDLNFVTAIRTGNNGERLEKRGRSESSWLVDWLVGWLIDRLIDR